VKFPVDEQRWLAWHYTNKAVPSSKFWQRAHESILCLWQPGRRRPALEVEQIRVPYTAHFKQCAGRERKGTRGRYSRAGKRTIYADNGGALPRDVLSVPALAGGAGRAERSLVRLPRLRRRRQRRRRCRCRRQRRRRWQQHGPRINPLRRLRLRMRRRPIPQNPLPRHRTQPGIRQVCAELDNEHRRSL